MNTEFVLYLRQYTGQIDLVCCCEYSTLIEIFNIWLKKSNYQGFDPNLHAVWFNIYGRSYGRDDLKIKINTIPISNGASIHISIVHKNS